jgi:serine/threonine-protein kinase
MRDLIGHTLGHYRIVEKIGEGGMGVVYRAHDDQLGRDVAIKVLPEEVASDPDRVARFQREARALAALNHPNIATVHGFETVDTVSGLGSGSDSPLKPQAASPTTFMVMELVEGESLAIVIGRGAVPVDEALGVAWRIAEGLEAAHERGITHRDLKPANVMVGRNGSVKLLDFGLAKVWRDEPLEADITHFPTATVRMTTEGVILGTAAYMSPEQARGRPVDKRCDIWAFGCVLYEMLTGARAFGGDTASDILAAILKEEPDWSALPGNLPPALRRLLRRCLEKDPLRRLRDIGEARIVLENHESDNGIDEVAGQPPGAKQRTFLPWLIAAAAGIAAVVFGWVAMRPESLAPVQRLAVDLPAGHSLALRFSVPLALSPDGSRLVYAASRNGGDSQLFARALDSFESMPVPGTEGADSPFFSPDGRWVAFTAGNTLRKVSLAGGAPVDICELPQLNPGGTWGPDGTIVFSADRFGLMRVPESGGAPVRLVTREGSPGNLGHAYPVFLPDGRHLLFTVANPDGPFIAVLSLETLDWREVTRGGGAARYLPSGHLVFTRAGGLNAIAFDLDRLEARGEPVQIMEEVCAGPGRKGFGMSAFSVSESGVLAFVPGGVEAAMNRLVWVNRQGEPEALPTEPGSYEWPRLSPDGLRVAVTDRAMDGPTDIWLLELERGTRSLLTAGGYNLLATWAPDGETLHFAHGGAAADDLGVPGLYHRRADGTGSIENVVHGEHPRFPREITADGRALLFVEWHPETARDIWRVPLDGVGSAETVLASDDDEFSPALSPDQRWLAYVSNESGRYEVYVRPWPDGGGRTIVSIGGGFAPAWAGDGSELYYRIGESLMVVAVEGGDRFSAGAPRTLFEGRYQFGIHGSSSYDVAADGRFLMIQANRREDPDRVYVVSSWFNELLRLVPVD